MGANQRYSNRMQSATSVVRACPVCSSTWLYGPRISLLDRSVNLPPAPRLNPMIETKPHQHFCAKCGTNFVVKLG